MEGDGPYYKQPRTEIRPRPQHSFDGRIRSENPAGIPEYLAAAQRDVLRRLDHVPAELAYGDLERRACTERRLFEEQGDVASFERAIVADARGPRPLQFGGKAQAGLEPLGVEVANGQKT